MSSSTSACLLPPGSPAEFRYCILRSDQSCSAESSSSRLKGLGGASVSTLSRSSSWTRDRAPRLPESQPTVSAARPGDSSADRGEK